MGWITKIFKGKTKKSDSTTFVENAVEQGKKVKVKEDKNKKGGKGIVVVKIEK